MVYAIRYYTLPLLLALGLHALAGYALYGGWNPEKELSMVIKPQSVKANLIVMEPKAKKARTPPPPPKKAVQSTKPLTPVKTPEKKAEPKPDPALEKKKKEQAEAAKRREEQARKQAQREQRLAELSQMSDASLEQALADEAADLQSGDDESIAQSYRLALSDLVRQNWSRPPSARNGMQVRLLVELIPTGDVSSVTIVESSGNVAFDRSAEQAVRRARRFEVPEDNSIFERHFRRFYFLFQPEDLLR